MDAVLSVQGASAPVKKKSFFSKFTRKKSFFSKFTRLNMLRLARAVIPAAVLMMFFPQLAMAASSSGQDLMQSGNATLRRPSVRTPVLLNGLFWLKFWSVRSCT